MFASEPSERMSGLDAEILGPDEGKSMPGDVIVVQNNVEPEHSKDILEPDSTIHSKNRSKGH